MRLVKGTAPDANVLEGIHSSNAWRDKMRRRNEASMATNARDNWYMDNARREERGEPKISYDEWVKTRPL